MDVQMQAMQQIIFTPGYGIEVRGDMTQMMDSFKRLLIGLVKRYHAAGVPRDEAVATACPQRLRPTHMTAMITIIAMAPVAFFPKTGVDAYSPLATAVIGGLTVGTIISLLDIPILHTYADDFI
ncbi:MAG TPA: efflux RND transporter permease subunit [Armatimonadota bacterium]